MAATAGAVVAAGAVVIDHHHHIPAQCRPGCTSGRPAAAWRLRAIGSRSGGRLAPLSGLAAEAAGQPALSEHQPKSASAGTRSGLQADLPLCATLSHVAACSGRATRAPGGGGGSRQPPLIMAGTASHKYQAAKATRASSRMNGPKTLRSFLVAWRRLSSPDGPVPRAGRSRSGARRGGGVGLAGDPGLGVAAQACACDPGQFDQPLAGHRSPSLVRPCAPRLR